MGGGDPDYVHIKLATELGNTHTLCEINTTDIGLAYLADRLSVSRVIIKSSLD
jgi:hypothetical protein